MSQTRRRANAIFSRMTNRIARIKEDFISSKAPENRRPITVVTENAFRIIRRCDVDKTVSSTGKEHSFIVRDPGGYELDITVDIADQAIAEIVLRSRGRLTLASSFWIACAERHLATYLWEHGDYPPGGSLTVDYLTPEDVDLARRWRDEPSSPPTQSSAHADSVHTLNIQRLTDDGRRPQRQPQPIKLLTENGYSIVRRSDIDASAADNANLCGFIVEDPNHNKRDIYASFDGQLIADIQRRRHNLPLSTQSKYWLVCAESQLAAYLWEHNQFPPEGNLKISELSGDELLMAQHWRDGES